MNKKRSLENIFDPTIKPIMMKTIIFISFLTFYSITSSAQEVVASGGDSFSNGSVQLDYTLGELSIETLSPNIVLTQGFHQGSHTITSIAEITPINFEIFPNPTTDWIQFTSDNVLNRDATIEILDLLGRVIKTKKTSQINGFNVSLKDIPTGTYVIHITMNDEKSHISPITIIKQ